MAILAKINPFHLRKKEFMRISDYLDPDLVLFLDVSSRDEAIDALVDLLDQKKCLPDKELFREKIFHREQLVSTGIGMGVAIPHAKMKGLSHFFIAIGIQKKKGLDWNALDKAPTRLIFMIGGPEDQQTEYLQILSFLTSSIKEVDLRKKLLASESEKEVIRLFSSS